MKRILSQRLIWVGFASGVLLLSYVFSQRGVDGSNGHEPQCDHEIVLSHRSKIGLEISEKSKLTQSKIDPEDRFHEILELRSENSTRDEEYQALKKKLRTMVSLEEFRELLLVIPIRYRNGDHWFFEDRWKFYPIENNEAKFISLLNLALEIETQASAGSDLIEGMFFMLGKNLGNADYPDFYPILREREVSAQAMREFAYGFESVRTKHNEKQRARDFEFLDRLFDQKDDRFAPFGRAYSRLLVDFTDANLALDELIERFADRPETQKSAFV